MTGSDPVEAPRTLTEWVRMYRQLRWRECGTEGAFQKRMKVLSKLSSFVRYKGWKPEDLEAALEAAGDEPGADAEPIAKPPVIRVPEDVVDFVASKAGMRLRSLPDADLRGHIEHKIAARYPSTEAVTVQLYRGHILSCPIWATTPQAPDWEAIELTGRADAIRKRIVGPDTDRHCLDCGASVGPRKRYCPSCATKRKTASNGASQRRRRERHSERCPRCDRPIVGSDTSRCPSCGWSAEAA